MRENRRVRFATIEGIDRQDLPLAAEIWMDDLRQQQWVSRESLKLAALFVRYMSRPDPEMLNLNHIDRAYQMDGKSIVQTLRIMQIYGTVEAYSCENREVRVSLNLSLLHRLRVLEARERFSQLAHGPRPDLPSFTNAAIDKWVPETAATASSDETIDQSSSHSD